MNQEDNKILTFKVAIDPQNYVIIDAKSNQSLYDLAQTVATAFDAYVDKMFGYYSRTTGNVLESEEIYELLPDASNINHNYHDPKDATLGKVFIKSKKMLLLFDYGNEWGFIVECKEFSGLVPRTTYPKIIKKYGSFNDQQHIHGDNCGCH